MARVSARMLCLLTHALGYQSHSSNDPAPKTGQLMQRLLVCRQCLRWAWLRRAPLTCTGTASCAALRSRCSGGWSQGLR